MKTSHTPIQSVVAALAAVSLCQLASGQTIWTAGAGAGATNWSSAANWATAVVPGPGDTVEFIDLGTTGAPSNINNVVESSVFAGSIASLQYANTNGAHTTLIVPGQTLTLGGSLINGTETANDNSKNNVITGPGGALVVDSVAANVIVRQGGGGASLNSRTVLDMSGLDTFSGNIARVLIGVGTGGGQNRATGRWILARTNTITASSATAPAIDVGESGSNNGGGSSLYLGQTNAVFANTITVNRAKESGSTMIFNAAFPNAAAYFRGADGSSRIATFIVNDGGTGSGTFGGSGSVDLSGGTVDLLVDNLQISRANSNTGSTTARSQTATMTVRAGVLDVNTLQIGINTAANVNWGNGTLNVNGTALVVANTVLELGRTAAAANQGGDNTKGVLNINGGTVRAASISAAFNSTNNIIAMTNGTLVISNTAGPGINAFNITNSTLQLSALNNTVTMAVTNLTTGGTGTKINIGSIPPVGGYPAQFALIKYAAIGGAGFDFSVNSLPASPNIPYAGYISNNVANHSVDLVLTSGAIPSKLLTWNGTPSGDWDIATTANWLATNNPVVYNQSDFVTFDDTAAGTTTVNLTAPLLPASVIVSNNTKLYTFMGGGYLSGSFGGLIKQGSGTLVIDNSGANDFSGGVTIGGGTVQVGNNDSGGTLPAGTISDNATLAFARQDDVAFANTIAGTGAVTQNGSATGVLRLSGANTFNGAVTVLTGTLVPANNSALGTTNGATTINSGATLDVQGASGAAANSVDIRTESLVVSGDGVGGSGAIVNNSSVAQQNAIGAVTLGGNTTFGGSGRWDIRAASGKPASLSTGGHPYKITKRGVNQQVSLVGVNPIDAALGDIDILEGTFAVQTSTTQLGDPTHTITIAAGATLDVYQLSTPLNKLIVVNGDGATHSIFNENGSSFISGSITLNGPCLIDGAGTVLTLSGDVSGAGSFNKIGAGAIVLAGTVSPAGGITNLAGTLVLNGNGTVPLWSLIGTTLAGSGTNTANVQILGTLNPGSTNGPGVFTATAGLALQAGSGLAFDLGSTTAADGSISDRIEVSGDLDATNTPVLINAWQGRLQPGIYRLINYSGNLLADTSGAFSSASASASTSTRYSFVIDTSTPHQVNLIVSGSATDLKWASTLDSTWAPTAGTWIDLHTSAADVFNNGDSVLLDDSVAGVTNSLTISAGVAVLPFAVTNNSSANNYTVLGAGKISGLSSIVKSGPSTLTLLTTNDFTGPVNVQAGTLRVGASGALGATNAGTTIASGATLDLSSPLTNLAANGLNLGFEQITVSGAGVGGNGAIINSGTNSQQNALRFVTLAGDTTFGGPGDWVPAARPGRWDIRNPVNADVLSSGSAVLSTSGNGYDLTKVGSNWVAIVGVLVDPALANINVNGGLLSIEHASTMGDPTKTLTVTNGAVLEFWQNWPSNLLNKVVVLYGDGTNKPTLLNGDGANIFVGPLVLNSNCLVAVTNSLTLSNNVVSGSGGLIKAGAGPLTLWGANTYSGATFVNGGTLALAGSGSIAGSSGITLSSNTVVDVAARSDGTLALAGAQVLAGNGSVNGSLVVSPAASVSPGLGGPGLLSVSNAVTLQGTAVMDLVSPGTCDLIRASSSIAYGGTLNLNFTPGSLHVGDSYKLFSSGAGTYTGTFSISPATPGAGLKWDPTPLGTLGILGVLASVNPTPTNITAVVSGNGLELSWPADHTGWYLQIQTNAISAGLSATWVTLPGSSTTNHVIVPVVPANGSVFCRMVYTNSP